MIGVKHVISHWSPCSKDIHCKGKHQYVLVQKLSDQFVTCNCGIWIFVWSQFWALELFFSANWRLCMVSYLLTTTQSKCITFTSSIGRVWYYFQRHLIQVQLHMYEEAVPWLMCVLSVLLAWYRTEGVPLVTILFLFYVCLCHLVFMQQSRLYYMYVLVQWLVMCH